MSESLIRRRSLPDSLRYLARKLDEPLSDAERAGVALTLDSLADEADQPATAAKPDLLQALANALTALTMADEEPELEYDHIDCVSGTVWWGNPVWTAQQHLGRQQQSVGPVRPDEEPAT
ncbi:hypothetical protein [Streptomyces europaeiscabiei]|uniref:hypothetical protein n=1 Tax=Streptomyces europaeiscabiei TaxID=146819 RepID=UPI000E69B0FF|nr:hypothetical protein [Streptomyces europaeiscabiei]